MRTIKNPDTTFRKLIEKRIKANNGYCLSKPKGIKENKCPCRVFRETGICDCDLYINIPDNTDEI
jgi:ferredoxin-thioredoxin reductase catalytic subunit